MRRLSKLSKIPGGPNEALNVAISSWAANRLAVIRRQKCSYYFLPGKLEGTTDFDFTGSGWIRSSTVGYSPEELLSHRHHPSSEWALQE